MKTKIEGEIEVMLFSIPEEFRDFKKKETFLDADGFPRSDVDVWTIRHTRVSLIKKHEDLRGIKATPQTFLKNKNRNFLK